MTSKNSSQKQNSDVQDRIDLAVMKTTISNIDSNVKSIQNNLTANYVTQDQFYPVKKVVYGMVGIVLFAVVGALVALVVKK